MSVELSGPRRKADPFSLPLFEQVVYKLQFPHLLNEADSGVCARVFEGDRVSYYVYTQHDA